jgi:hypothetical protein
VVHQPTGRVEDQVGVEELPQTVRGPFVDPDREHHAVLRGDRTQHIGVRAGHRDGGLDQPAVQVVLVDRGQHPVPDRETGQEGLAEDHQFGSLCRGLGDQAGELVDGAVPVEKDGRGLHRGDLDPRHSWCRHAPAPLGSGLLPTFCHLSNFLDN